MERQVRFLLIYIGKGLSWMAAEVKSKAQRFFEGQWEGPPLVLRLLLLLLVMVVVHSASRENLTYSQTCSFDELNLSYRIEIFNVLFVF